MTQLSYQAAFDPFHAVFRLLRLREMITTLGPKHRDAVRIIDFYLLFPFRINEIRLYPKHRAFKALAKKYESLKPYGELPESIILFERMESMEMAALETAVAKGYFSSPDFRKSLVASTDGDLPDELNNRIQQLNTEQADLMKFLGVLVSEYSLDGEDGLKARTKLLEYRYDPI